MQVHKSQGLLPCTVFNKTANLWFFRPYVVKQNTFEAESFCERKIRSWDIESKTPAAKPDEETRISLSYEIRHYGLSVEENSKMGLF